MYKNIFYFLCVVFSAACSDTPKFTSQAKEVVKVKGLEIPIYDFESFKPMLEIRDGKTRVINFWATWCKPCVAELPYFELVNSRYSDDQVEVILVSLDLPMHAESKLIPFIKRQALKSKVVLLDDPDANSWIPKVNSNWSGAIPATIIYKDNTVNFYERSFTYNELEKEIKKIL